MRFYWIQFLEFNQIHSFRDNFSLLLLYALCMHFQVFSLLRSQYNFTIFFLLSFCVWPFRMQHLSFPMIHTAWDQNLNANGIAQRTHISSRCTNKSDRERERVKQSEWIEEWRGKERKARLNKYAYIWGLPLINQCKPIQDQVQFVIFSQLLIFRFNFQLINRLKFLNFLKLITLNSIFRENGTHFAHRKCGTF